MIAVQLFGVFVIFIICFFIFSQVVIPVFSKDIPFFWLFREGKPDMDTGEMLDRLDDIMNDKEL